MELKDIPLVELDLENFEKNGDEGDGEDFNPKEMDALSLFLPSAANKRSVIQTIFQNTKLNNQQFVKHYKKQCSKQLGIFQEIEMLLNIRQVEGSGHNKKEIQQPETDEKGEKIEYKKDLYGGKLKKKTKKPPRYTLFESKPQTRKQVSYFMTFLSLLNLHKTLIKSFKNESDSVIRTSKVPIPGYYKGLIYRLIFLKTIYLTRKSHYLKDTSGIIGSLLKCAQNLLKCIGFNFKYTSS